MKMKLAEALAERADLQKRLQQVTHRAQAAARYQDGEEPAENVNALLEEGLRLAHRVSELVTSVNRNNSLTPVTIPAHAAGTAADRSMSITEAIALRDRLQAQRKLLAEVTEAAAGSRGMFSYRRSRSELAEKTDLNVAARRREADEYAKRHREVDSAIQQANWNTEML